MICPVPRIWNEIHQALFAYWQEKLEMKGVKPPVPLILAGWNFSSDFEKSERWKETVKWAEKMNCTHLIKELSDDDKYFA